MSLLITVIGWMSVMNFNKNMNTVINDFLEPEINGLISKNYFLDEAKKYKNNRTKNSIKLMKNTVGFYGKTNTISDRTFD